MDGSEGTVLEEHVSPVKFGKYGVLNPAVDPRLNRTADADVADTSSQPPVAWFVDGRPVVEGKNPG